MRLRLLAAGIAVAPAALAVPSAAQASPRPLVPGNKLPVGQNVEPVHARARQERHLGLDVVSQRGDFGLERLERAQGAAGVSCPPRSRRGTDLRPTSAP